MLVMKLREATRYAVVVWIARLALALSIPMMLTGVLIEDMGGHPSGIWHLVGIFGVALAVVSLGLVAYDLIVVRRPFWLRQRR